MPNKETHCRTCLLYLLLILSFFSRALWAAEFTSSQYTTDWLVDFKHPAVAVQMQLTGEKNSQLKMVDALLQVELQGDWKTYWRSPGDGGAAPTLDFSQSTNIDNVTWQWPAPSRYNVLGVDTLGYKGTVNFPITLHLQDFTKPAMLSAVLTVSSCTTICVQNDYHLALQFVGEQLAVNKEATYLYREAQAKVPIKLDTKIKNQQLPVNIARSDWNNKQQMLTVELNNKTGWYAPDIFVDSSKDNLSNVTFSAPTLTISGNHLIAKMKASSWADPVNLDKHPINITVVDRGFAAELPTTPGVLSMTSSSQTLLSMFLIALMGGLILNVMPCVLPVLGMKLSSVLSAQGVGKGQVRRQFVASSLGIITSFWLLAGFLLTLKLSGQALGWGIQFQSPYFITLMVIVTALFAASMLDIFSFGLPVNMQTWLATKGAHSYLGHFLQGMFATLLATPCSAPFLGTAVAFSLAASSVQLFIIFTALGLGMAIPWLCIAAFPSLALLLPKPGRWMNGLKVFFGLMMLVTSYWLVSLLTSFIGVSLTLYLVLLLTVFFLYFLSKKQQKKHFWIVSMTILLTVTGGIGLSYYNQQSQQGNQLQWQALNRATIDSQVAQGRVVFVDVTAAWCITCKANKIGVILQDPVYSRLQQEDIVVMKGDWTTASERVTTYLQSYGRAAVPFNIVYGPNAPQGIELQTILTSDVVLNAITDASGKEH